MKADKAKLEKELDSLVEQLKKMGAKRILLFGSLARGSVRVGSDIDLIALFDDRDNFKTRLRRMYAEIESDASFDLLPYNFEEFEKLKDRSFFRHALRTGKVIYEAAP